VGPVHDSIVTEFELYSILDRLHPTATGLDRLPAWFFLRLGAPFFAGSQPPSQLFLIQHCHPRSYQCNRRKPASHPSRTFYRPHFHKITFPFPSLLFSLGSLKDLSSRNTYILLYNLLNHLFPLNSNMPFDLHWTGSYMAALIHTLSTIIHLLKTIHCVLVYTLTPQTQIRSPEESTA